IEKNKFKNKVKLNIKHYKKSFEINILKHKDDYMKFHIISPNNSKIKDISSKDICNKYIIENTQIEVCFNKEEESLTEGNVNIKFTSDEYIDFGTWNIVFIPIKTISGNIDIYLKAEDQDIKNELIESSNVSWVIFGSSVKYTAKTYLRTSIDDIDLNIYMPLFIIDYLGEFEEKLNELGDLFKFVKISENLGLLYIKRNRESEMGELYRIKSIYRIQRYIKLAQLTTVTRGIDNGYVATEEIGANFFKDNPNIDINGRGVLIGIANSGIDYLHPDFIYPDGTSKIRYLWDQTKEGNPPNGFYMGTEYTREDINKAIAENNKDLSVDEEGIGTALSGVCAGMGNVNKKYSGVAEGAELIVIKLKKIEDNYNIATLHGAMRYAYKKAKDENMPIVNNVSLGSTNAVVTGTLVITDNLFYEYGVCEVIAGGNEGSGKTHASGKIEFNGDIKYVEIEIEEVEYEINIDIWINKPDIANIAIISPSGEESKMSFVSNFDFIQGLFDLENTYYTMISSYPSNYSGQQLTMIRLNNVKKGIWRIKLVGESITNGIFNIYLPNEVLLKKGTKFRTGDPNVTLTYPSGYKDTITVGVYDSINDSLWINSSRGPTVGSTGRIDKPDVISPGVNIIAPYIDNQYATFTGSGIASAFVSGAMALMFQYILVDKNYKNKAIVQKMRTYLRAGAKRKILIQYPNNSHGYGLLDIKGLFDQLK
ncbi:MAG: S8 family serine peptidase, partial [Peptostreptococcaceae bacterium]